MKDEDIQQKLVELESAILREDTRLKESTGLAPAERSTELVDTPVARKRRRKGGQDTYSAKSDLQYFGGIGCLLLGLFLLLQHVRVTSSYMTWWGMAPGNSVGFLMVPLIIGIGWIIYNSKSLWGWLISAVSLFTIVFTIISGLRIYFAPISMLGLIFMLIPLAAGGALVLKGMGGPQGVEEAIRNRVDRRD